MTFSNLASPRGINATVAAPLRRRILATTAMVCVLAVAPMPGWAAGTTTDFTVGGIVSTPLTETDQSLQTLPQTTLSVHYLAGGSPVSATESGPTLWSLINAAGVETNASVKNDTLREYVLATGSDGYQVVFSVGEINPSFGGSATNPDLVSILENGAALTSDGFARTVAPGDSFGGRYDSNLTSIDVFHAPTQTGAFTGGNSSQLTVTGQVTAAQTFTLAGLQALPATTLTAGGGAYTGVNLWTLLTKVGVVTNPTIKNNILTDYVVATGTDGYQAIVSLGEIDPNFGNQPDLVAYALNGGTLGSNGFARLVVPNDSKQGRWVSNLENLEVFDATLWTANANEQVDLTALTINALGFHLNGGNIVSTGGAGVLIVPQASLDGGTIAAGVTIQSTSAVAQSSGTSVIAGTIAAPAVNVNAGVLQLAGGSITGATTIASGAQLTGAGAIGGSLTLAAGSTTALTVSASTPTALLQVGGAANVAGTLQLSSDLTVKTGATYTLISAQGGVAGAFTSLAVSPGFAKWVTPNLVYASGAVEVNLAANTISPALGSAATSNTRHAAAAVDALLRSGNAAQPFNNLFYLSQSDLNSQLGSLAGEAATGVRYATLQSGGAFLDLMLDPSARANSEAPAAAASVLSYAAAANGAAGQAIALATAPPPRSPWSVWGATLDGAGVVGANAATGASKTTSVFGEIAVGADYRVDPSTVAGFAIAGGANSFSLASGSGNGAVFQAGVYATKRFGAGYVAAAAEVTNDAMNVTRSASLGGQTETLKSAPDGLSFGGRLEAGAFLGNFGLAPYGALDAQSFHSSAYSESSTASPSLLGLNYAANQEGSLRSELGFRWVRYFDNAADPPWTVSARLAWAHEFFPDSSVTAALQALPTASFSVNGAGLPANVALASLEAEARLPRGISLFAKLGGELAPGSKAVRGDLGVRYVW
jgi:uncharacterized protein with beta-barrel porin domain